MPNIINGDNGVVSGSAGLKSSSDGTGVLALQTNGTTAVTIDASQNTTLAGTLTLGTATQAVPSGTAPLYAARAWVNFNGTGAVAIRASGNVTSITDNGTGDYTVNFTTAMTDANYAWSGSYGADNSSTQGFIAGVASVALATSKTASSLRINSAYGTGTANDIASVSVVVFR
jgi:hypothetical protein